MMESAPPTTRCPVEDCEFGERETKRFAQVIDHVTSAGDAAHAAERQRHDWTYEYAQIE